MKLVFCNPDWSAQATRPLLRPLHAPLPSPSLSVLYLPRSQSHTYPEGLATFVATLASPSAGAAIAVAIALHNIPEGVVVAMPIYYATGSKWKVGRDGGKQGQGGEGRREQGPGERGPRGGEGSGEGQAGGGAGWRVDAWLASRPIGRGRGLEGGPQGHLLPAAGVSLLGCPCPFGQPIPPFVSCATTSSNCNSKSCKFHPPLPSSSCALCFSYKPARPTFPLPLLISFAAYLSPALL